MRRRVFGLALLLTILCLAGGGSLAQTGVRALVVNEFENVRVVPALGAEVLGTVPGGYVFEIVTARSPDNQWLRVDFNGNEGWVHVAPLQVIAGDINALPVADPRTIPYGGFEAPRAGLTGATSAISVRLPLSGVRVRAGPSTGYPVLANAPRYTVMPALGRTANNAWVQVNFEGTLGWVTAEWVEFQNGAAITSLPVDGIVADSPPLSDPVGEDYIATLRLMLDRIDLAQPSLDAIRAAWTDAALTGRASCAPYPPRPSDYNIPNELLAAFYPTLNPLITLFNDAMFNVRETIDLFIEVCNQPGTGNPVGQATVIGALDVVALADFQFAELRRRIREALPDIDPDAGCLFEFQGRVQVVRFVNQGQLVTDSLSREKMAVGFCFDAAEGQQLVFEVLRLGDANMVQMLVLSQFDNPTNFLSVTTASTLNPLLSVGPLTMPQTGRYLAIVSHSGELPPDGQFAFIVSPPIPGETSILKIDPNTGQIVVPTPAPTPIIIPPASAGTTGLSGQTSPGGQTVSAVCPGVGLSCEQLASCDEAYACLRDGNFSLDPDEDGVPCEIVRCPSSP